MNQPIENRPIFNICNSSLAHHISHVLQMTQQRSSHKKAVCLSVRLSVCPFVKRVDCEKTEESYGQIFYTTWHERSIFSSRLKFDSRFEFFVQDFIYGRTFLKLDRDFRHSTSHQIFNSKLSSYLSRNFYFKIWNPHGLFLIRLRILALTPRFTLYGCFEQKRL